MHDILNLEPKELWKNFHLISQIPRPSKHEMEIISFLKNFGEKLSLETITDSAGNLIIRKPAASGYENRKGIILQAHVDMVPQKNAGVAHNFEKDPIDTIIDNEWVKANDTTLGADNGIGVAAMMAVLESKTLQHGPIEALFTIDEETGLTGATMLQPYILNGHILLNLDTEDDNELIIGCAGGLDTAVTFSCNIHSIPDNFNVYEISVKGLRGGHSGIDINLGLGNSNKLLNRIIMAISARTETYLCNFSGGNLRNAIPREADALIAVSKKNEQELKQIISQQEHIIRNELKNVEPALEIVFRKTDDKPASCIDIESSRKILHLINALPHGVVRMDDNLEKLVESSVNLAIVDVSGQKASVHLHLRSSIDSAKENIALQIESVASLAGANISCSGNYPGWTPDVNSPILEIMKDLYTKLFNETPHTGAVHAGLECGIIKSVYPHLDTISFGPTIKYPHSPHEKVSIASVRKFWIYLIEVLKNIPVQ